jgi:Ca-activated chloride channel family protein
MLRVRAADMPRGPVRIAGDLPAGRWTADLTLDDAFDDFGVGALWARAKIDALFDEQRRGADERRIRASVIDTALTHRLVSRYTSLVAVDKTPARQPGVDLESHRVPSLIPKGQLAGFPATATNAALLRVIAGMLFLAAGLLFLKERWSRVPTHS